MLDQHEAIPAFFLFQVEDTFQEGQEKEEEQDKGDIKAEDNAIEMSEDFDGQMHDGEEKEPGNYSLLILILHSLLACSTSSWVS